MVLTKLSLERVYVARFRYFMRSMQLFPGVFIKRLIHALLELTTSLNYLLELFLVVESIVVFVYLDLLAGNCSDARIQVIRFAQIWLVSFFFCGSVIIYGSSTFWLKFGTIC